MENINIEEVLFKYKAAIKVLETKLEIIYKELNNNNYNCIEHINSRIKTKKSIENKLIQDGYEVTEENIKNKLHDIAGIRIVCSFLKDVKIVEKLIEEDEDLRIIKRKDYITNPKNSGYSSLHLLVEVPIKLINSKEYVEVEIQIRTIAMDMWASLEHKLYYKNDGIKNEYNEQKMRDFSYETKKIDNKMEQMIIESEKYNSTKENNNNKYKKELNIIENTPMLKYELAQMKINEMVEEINHELKTNSEVKLIEHIKTRIKKPERIIQKLERLQYEITEKNMNDHIHDLVGIRIVCPFLNDLEEIKKILLIKILNHNNIQLIKVKDYIRSPKKNGYRSYHMNIIVPIDINNQKEYVEVEIQIRTIAMDMWATLEHKICYRKNGNIPEYIKDELKTISEETSKIDKTFNDAINKNKQNNNIKKLVLKKNM